MRLFGEAMDLDLPERSELLARVRDQDAELAKELLAMVDVGSHTDDGFLADPLAAPPAAFVSSVPEIPGYIDLQLIGEGGMGSVYRANQVQPVRRTVAIKTIRPGADSSQVLARFDVERQALARMGHRAIATVYDAGLDSLGRPYLVMEFVDGQSITDYCDAQGLSLDARLGLLAEVCDAIEHAHRRGVLHRDLKPSNILVAQSDNGPSPKVIDFGIAKSLEGHLGEQSVHTLQGALLGTPDYMSPEQLNGDIANVDTRTDVYALGVLLYELIAGTRPFDSGRLKDAGITEWIRIVREEVPPKPSTRLLQRAGTKTIEERWTRRLSGDLDWVVMKALDKDPERRYQTPRDLADDVRRFLANLPVEAGPPSATYRLRKFVRRYRGWVASVAVIILLLAVGLIGVSILAANNKALAGREQTARADAEAASQRLRESLYRSQMRLGTETMTEVGGVSRLREIVKTWVPAPEQSDLRGFEWHLLAANCRRELRVLPGEPLLRRLAWFADGRLVSTHNQFAVAWNAVTGVRLSQWRTEVLPVGAVALSGNGKRLARSVSREVVALYDAESGAELQRFSHGGYVLSCMLSDDGSLLASEVDYSGSHVWDTRKQRKLIAAPGSGGGVALTTNGSMFAVGWLGDVPSIRIYRREQPSEVYREFTGPRIGKWRLAFDARATRIAVVNGEGELRIWSVETGDLLLTKSHPDGLRSLAFDPSGTRVAVGCDNSAIYVHNLETRARHRLRGHSDYVTGVAWSPDGGQLVSMSEDATIRYWEPNENEPRREVRLVGHKLENPSRLAFDAAGEVLSIELGSSGTRSWNLSDNDVRSHPLEEAADERLRRAKNLALPDVKIEALALSAICPETGVLALATGWLDPLWLWPEGAGAPAQRTAPVHVMALQWLAGCRLAVINGSSNLSVIDGATAEELWTQQVPARALALAVYPRDGTLAIGCADQTIRLWSLEHGEFAVLRGHAGYVEALAFSPDGLRLASGSRDRTVRIWDVAAKAEVAGLSVSGRVAAVAFSPDGTRLGAVDSDGQAVVWDTRGSRAR